VGLGLGFGLGGYRGGYLAADVKKFLSRGSEFDFEIAHALDEFALCAFLLLEVAAGTYPAKALG
jgi:hypothetical protein